MERRRVVAAMMEAMKMVRAVERMIATSMGMVMIMGLDLSQLVTIKVALWYREGY